MTGNRGAPGDRAKHFTGFFDAHAGGLGRLAYLLVGDRHAAEDLLADVFLDVWRSWERVSATDHPLAYVRRIMINKAGAGIRRTIRERLGIERLQAVAEEVTFDPDGATSVDVQSLLMELPAGQRACVVLRYALDLSEAEVADALGVTVGTVKSQTSKGARSFRQRMDETGADGGRAPRGRDGAPLRAAGRTGTTHDTTVRRNGDGRLA